MAIQYHGVDDLEVCANPWAYVVIWLTLGPLTDDVQRLYGHVRTWLELRRGRAQCTQTSQAPEQTREDART